jgi:hypothetical protein
MGRLGSEQHRRSRRTAPRFGIASVNFDALTGK